MQTISTWEIPSIYNYERAKRVHDAIHPVRGRGRNAGVRPIGNRRHVDKQILMNSAGDVVCRLWDTDVVTFTKDGRVRLFHGGWISQSTAKFASAVLGENIHWVSRTDEKLMYNTYNGEGQILTFLIPNQGLELYAETYLPSEYKPFKQHIVRRKEMMAVRRKHAELIKYTLGVCSLTDGRVPQIPETVMPSEYLTAVIYQLRAGSLDVVDDTDRRMVFAAMAMQHKALAVFAGWDNSRRSFSNTRGYEFISNKQKTKQGIDWLLRLAYWEDVMELKVLDYGVYKKDKYISELDTARKVRPAVQHKLV